jgi:S1-C subfamily serine protease
MNRWISAAVIAGLAVPGVSWGAPCIKVRPYEARLGVASSPVVIVTDVQTGGIADRAGLRPGDVILATNSHGVRDRVTFQDFLAQIREHALWQAADLTVLSQQVTRHVMIRLSTPEDRMGFVANFGFYVESVRAGSVADRLGMKAGEFITKASGTTTGNLKGPADLDLLIQEAVDGGKLTVEVSRLVSAERGMTLWTPRTLEILSQGPLDGPVPPPQKPEIIRQ